MRRLRKTFRPALSAIRFKNPCSRDRFRFFGWYVLLGMSNYSPLLTLGLQTLVIFGDLLRKIDNVVSMILSTFPLLTKFYPQNNRWGFFLCIKLPLYASILKK